MKSLLIFRIVALLALLAGGPLAIAAEDLGAVRARLAQRQPAVDDLRDRQIAGENNRGYLEIRGQATGPEQKTVSDENADRRMVYAALAAQTGSTAETVGRQRAQQIAIRSKRGVWIQDPRGEWRQKG